MQYGARVAARGLLPGIEVLRLDMGDPDLAPDPSVIEALAEGAYDPRSHHYQAGD